MAANGTLVARAAAPWPREAGWLVAGENVTWLRYMIVRRSGRDDGILEQPIGSNRGTRIDAITARAGLPVPKNARTGEGWWWCGIWDGAVWRDCGAKVPVEYPAVDAWLPHLVATPTPGDAVIYGPSPRDGTHIGLVTRVGIGRALRSPQGFECLTREGNRGYAGSATNNGITIDQAPLSRGDVLGFVPPQPVDGWTIAAYAPADFLLEHWAALPERERTAAHAKITAALR